MRRCLRDHMFSHFDTIPECDRHTDTRRRHIPRLARRRAVKTVLTSGERAKNAHSISLPSLPQHYLVAMATSLDKLENKVQVHHLHIKRFHMVK